MRVCSFAPIGNEYSRILILGTMPSVQSRKVGFYYSHPRNRFWRVLAGCFGHALPQSAAEKKQLLLANRAALWDVLASCEITGSDDSTIRKPMYNDIVKFIGGKPIEKVLCNGTKAYRLYLNLGLALPVKCMPSTSPANASWSAERLTAVWKSELVF